MTISVAHSFVSSKSQGADSTVVSKNEWNAAHSFTMATGALLGRTTAAAGAVEEITPSADFTLSGGALSPTYPIYRRVLTADASGSNSSTAQQVFPTNGKVAVEASTTYEFDAVYHIVRSAGTTSHTTGISFDGGTATFTSVRYLATVANPTGNVLSAPSQIVGEAETNVVVTAANTSATENLFIMVNGIIRINGSGTLAPMFKYSSAPGGAPTIKANSYIRLRKIGTDVMSSIGTWS
jgi:hypothetical protein